MGPPPGRTCGRRPRPAPRRWAAALLGLLLLAGSARAGPSAAPSRLERQLRQQRQLDQLLLAQLQLQQPGGQRRRPVDLVREPGEGAGRQQRRTGHAQRPGPYPAWQGADRPLVASRAGLVRGISQKLANGKFVDAFLGIPFGQPPLGSYRFRHPQPAKSWPGELDASRKSTSCYQTNDTVFGPNFSGTMVWNANTPLSEDCLHLNVWSPFGAANTSLAEPDVWSGAPAGRPVLVWIFGGGFMTGTSSLALYDGGLLASEEDIVVVSLNYRVAALGFLYFGRPEAPGNAGLFDQLLALQWIQENIGQFGGDPSRVTLFGESAGAVSVAFHLLSPLSRDLFSQAILQSGAATCPWGSMEPERLISHGLQLASLLNCPANRSQLDAVLECLLRADPMALVSQPVGNPENVLNFPFVPLVDGSFLLESPIDSLRKANFKRAPIMLGSNNDEGNSFLIYLPKINQCTSSNAPTSSLLYTASSLASSHITENSNPQQSPYLPKPDFTGPINNGASFPPEEGAPELALQSSQFSDTLPAIQNINNLLQHSTNTNTNNRLTQLSSQQPVSSQQQTSNQIQCKLAEQFSLSKEQIVRALREDVNPFADHPIAKEAILFEYTNWDNPKDPLSNHDLLDKVVGDYSFTCHVNEFGQRYAQAGNPVFMYYFRHRSSVSPWPKWMGVLHGDELSFIFGDPVANHAHSNYTPKEVELSRRMMQYWANFAKYGNPTKLSDNQSMPEKWPEYSDRRQYFELHADSLSTGRGPRSKQCAFWSHYLPKLLTSLDRNQCGSLATRGQLPRNPLELVADERNLASHQNSFLLSPTLISILVILVLACLLGLLVYAKRSGKLELSGGSD